MPILNYSTSIDASKTVQEITKLLSKNGVKKLIFDNGEHGEPVAITFLLDVPINGIVKTVAFCLPCRHEAILKVMLKDKKIPRTKCTKEQAIRVGWRILKVWIEAQTALVQTEMASMAEVFLPYAVTKEGNTLYEIMTTKQFNLLDYEK